MSTALSTVLFVVMTTAGLFLIRDAQADRQCLMSTTAPTVDGMPSGDGPTRRPLAPADAQADATFAAAWQSAATSVSLVMFIPIYLVVVNSLKTDAQARSMGAGLPRELRWENYDVVIEEGKLTQAFPVRTA